MEFDLRVYGEVDSLYFFFCVLAIKKWRVFECLGLWVLDFLKARFSLLSAGFQFQIFNE